MKLNIMLPLLGVFVIIFLTLFYKISKSIGLVIPEWIFGASTFIFGSLIGIASTFLISRNQKIKELLHQESAILSSIFLLFSSDDHLKDYVEAIRETIDEYAVESLKYPLHRRHKLDRIAKKLSKIILNSVYDHPMSEVFGNILSDLKITREKIIFYAREKLDIFIKAPLYTFAILTIITSLAIGELNVFTYILSVFIGIGIFIILYFIEGLEKLQIMAQPTLVENIRRIFNLVGKPDAYSVRMLKEYPIKIKKYPIRLILSDGTIKIVKDKRQLKEVLKTSS